MVLRVCPAEWPCKSIVVLWVKFEKATASGRLDLTLKDKEKKILWICDMTCPQENNIVTKWTKYRQLAFKLRERRAEYKTYVIPVIIGALGGGIKEAIHEVKKIFKQDDLSEKIVREMQRTILMSGLAQTEILQI